MIVKPSPPPDHIILEKNSSGTWESERSRKPPHRLQSWQRLWIVTGLVWLLMLAGSWYLIMPTSSAIDRRMVFAVTEEIRRYDGLAFAGSSPERIFEIARSKGFGQWIAEVRRQYHIGPEGNAGFDRILRTREQEKSSLPFKLAFGILFYMIAWMVPMGIFYGICWVVDWIKRGGQGRQT